MTKKKVRTGWRERVDGFAIPDFRIQRNSEGLYDVDVYLKDSGQSIDFFNDTRTFTARIFTGIESRKEALRLAKSARRALFSLVGEQIKHWAAGYHAF